VMARGRGTGKPEPKRAKRYEKAEREK